MARVVGGRVTHVVRDVDDDRKRVGAKPYAADRAAARRSGVGNEPWHGAAGPGDPRPRGDLIERLEARLRQVAAAAERHVEPVDPGRHERRVGRHLLVQPERAVGHAHARPVAERRERKVLELAHAERCVHDDRLDPRDDERPERRLHVVESRRPSSRSCRR